VDESWTCIDCGWVNRGGRFCFECGRDGNPDPIPVQRLAPEPSNAEPRWRRLALVAGAVALLAIVVVVAALLLSGDDSKAPAAKPPPPVPAKKLDRAQTVDELMKIVIASRTGLAAAREGEWAQANQNRKRLIGRLDVLATRTDEVEAARTALASALVASKRANSKSLACKDRVSVSACAAPAHRRATALKERFRALFNKILDTDGRGRAHVAPNSF
jgi:cell division septation protein DedD